MMNAAPNMPRSLPPHRAREGKPRAKPDLIMSSTSARADGQGCVKLVSPGYAEYADKCPVYNELPQGVAEGTPPKSKSPSLPLPPFYSSGPFFWAGRSYLFLFSTKSTQLVSNAEGSSLWLPVPLPVTWLGEASRPVNCQPLL